MLSPFSFLAASWIFTWTHLFRTLTGFLHAFHWPDWATSHYNLQIIYNALISFTLCLHDVWAIWQHVHFLSWCNCPLCSKICLTFIFQEDKSWEAALERTRCHLCLIWNVFHVRAAKPGSYWRALVPPSQWPSKYPSLSTTLPALVWGVIMNVQMCLMPWEGVSCKGCHRSLVTTLGKFHSLPFAPWSSGQLRCWDDEDHSILPHG